MKWRILISGKMDPYLNMALDEAIYNAVAREEAPPTLRFYDWQPAAFSYGYNQLIEKELDFELLKDSPYSFVRRPTGGRMVLHEDEVTYAVISPLQESMAGNISHTYLRIGTALVSGLKAMNVAVELAKGELSLDDQKRSANPCFTSPSRFELTYKRKKLVGSAQTRNSRAFLQHGSILRTFNQKNVARFIPSISQDDRLRMSHLLERRTISLKSILERIVTFEEVVKNLITGFEEEWSDDTFFMESEPTVQEMRTAKELISRKYSTEEWNRNTKKNTKRV